MEKINHNELYQSIRRSAEETRLYLSRMHCLETKSGIIVDVVSTRDEVIVAFLAGVGERGISAQSIPAAGGHVYFMTWAV